MECGGYAARIYSHYKPFVVVPFIVQYFLIVVVSDSSLIDEDRIRADMSVPGTVYSCDLPLSHASRSGCSSCS